MRFKYTKVYTLIMRFHAISCVFILAPDNKKARLYAGFASNVMLGDF